MIIKNRYINEWKIVRIFSFKTFASWDRAKELLII